jgi:hypothetical protein
MGVLQDIFDRIPLRREVANPISCRLHGLRIAYLEQLAGRRPLTRPPGSVCTGNV